MGIHGLYQFLRKKAPTAISECSIDQLAGKTAALDGNSFLYKFTYFYGGELDKVAADMEDLLTFLVQNKVRPVVVFDGPGDDDFFGQGNAATLAGPNYAISLDSFAAVVAYATAGGTNRKHLAALNYAFTAVGDWL